MPRTIVDETTVGIEVECFVDMKWFDNGTLRIGQTVRTADSPLKGWEIKHDGSLNSPSGDKTACEIVSPVLHYPSDLIQIAQAVTYIRDELGGIVNETCGGHIHVGIESITKGASKGKTTGYVMDLCENMVGVQDAMYLVGGGEKRKNNTYSAPIKRDVIDKMSYETIMKGNRIKAAINPQTNHKTTEFRIWIGSVNPNYWVNNIHMSARLCEMTYKNLPVPPIDIDPLDPQKAVFALERLFGFPKGTLELTDKLMWVWRPNARKVYGAVRAVPRGSERGFNSQKACWWYYQHYLESDTHKIFTDAQSRKRYNSVMQRGTWDRVSAEISARRSLRLRTRRATTRANNINATIISD